MDNLNNDITRYLKGEMSPAEMHELEKKALNDPFLADALEGAGNISPDRFVEDVDSLNKSITRKRKHQLYWPLRIAASILVVISITYYLININTSKEESTLALNKDSSGESSPVENMGQPTDSAIVSNEVALDQSELTVKTDNGQKKPETEIVTKPKTLTLAEESSSAVATGSSAQDQLTVLEKEDDEVTAEQLRENTEDAVAAEINISRDERQRLAQSSKKAMTQEAAPLAEMRYDQKEAKKSSPKKISSPKPVITHESYQQYLLVNVQYPQTAIENGIHGEVVVEFLVDSHGNLSEFKIEKGIGSGCDEELIRAIKEGPQWLPATIDDQPVNQKTTVSFTFELPK